MAGADQIKNYSNFLWNLTITTKKMEIDITNVIYNCLITVGIGLVYFLTLVFLFPDAIIN